MAIPRFFPCAGNGLPGLFKIQLPRQEGTPKEHISEVHSDTLCGDLLISEFLERKDGVICL